MNYFRDLELRITTSMQPDRHRLRNLLKAVRKAEELGHKPDDKLERLLKLLDESNRRREERQALVPRLVYDESLPVVGRREDIVAAIRDRQVIVVSGETGSGKSTQLPKICLEAGRGVCGMIGHTQPRRIAARSIAARLAEELETAVGKKVGFKIRFADATSPETLVKVMTDGVLLAESQHDRFFDQYDTLIIDEAHERSLNIDFLLGYLQRLLLKRPDLRVIITSATIDAQRFAAHFVSDLGPAPIIEVSGRTYPVEVLYRPLRSEESDEEIDVYRGVADAVEEACSHGPGDVLVFLPTERDILETAHKLRGRSLPGGAPQILPLYARLSTVEQNRVFSKHSGRRIVLATNVAESSLTVPGIRFVVDTGTARISRYSARSKVQRLPIERISQASADQRKGRCGRIGPGVCIRLFSEDDCLTRERYTSPEIQRTNLAAVILQLLSLELGSVDEFPFLDPPRAESIRDGYKTLFELGAIEQRSPHPGPLPGGERGTLTPLGRRLAKLPVDPRIGRMILAAEHEGCLADVLIIAAALEVQDPRDRPADRQQVADAAHAQWLDPDSDFLSWLKLWDFVQGLKERISRNQFKKACRQNFLSELRLREWQNVHRQLLEMVRQFGLKAGKRRYTGSVVRLPGRADRRDAYPTENPAFAAIHRSLLAGLLSSIAVRGDTNEYVAAGGGKFSLWPGSGVYPTKPKWIVAAELVETTRRYLRIVARIDRDWIEPLAGHLVTRSYSDPHWDRRAGGAVAKEKVSLLGLTIVPERRVRYTAIDPKVSRQLFIQQGLVAGDFDTKAEFFRHNQRLVADLEARAAKVRKRELLVDPQIVADFYEAKLPAVVCDGPSLDKWRRDAERQNRRVLFMTEEDLLGSDPEVSAAEFPDVLDLERMKLPLVYHFEPGAPEDGVTVTVPREGLSQLSEERLGWLVPGLVADKVQALIKSLPKAVRRELGPAPEVAAKIAAELQFATGPLLPQVAAALTKAGGERITADMFDLERLPPYLLMQVRVLDGGGKTVIEGRNLAAIREHLREEGPTGEAAPAASPWHREGLTRWEFGAIPEQLEMRRGGITLAKYPTVVDAGAAVSLRLLDSPAQARRQMRLGVLRLFALAEHRELRAQIAWLPGIERIRVISAPLAKQRKIDDQVADLIAERAFYATDAVPRTPEDFAAQRLLGKKNILPAVQEVTGFLGPLFEAYHEARLLLEQARPPSWQYAVDDICEQVGLLLPEGFLTATPWSWLVHYPRYLKAISLRFSKLASGLPRDRQQQALLTPRWDAYQERVNDHVVRGIDDLELQTYRWMLEEFRVSLFAQELGTSVPVSPQRLDKQWSKVQV